MAADDRASPARARRGQRAGSILIILGALAPIGCFQGTRPPCDNPPPVYVVVTGSDRLNPDARGQPLSTEVHVLMLRAPDRLRSADFLDVWQKGKDVLGDELLQERDVTVDPSASVTVPLPRDAKATHVAVVAIFRQPTGTQWYGLTRLGPVSSEGCAAQPVEVKDSPGPKDLQLRFRLEDFRVEPVIESPNAQGATP